MTNPHAHCWHPVGVLAGGHGPYVRPHLQFAMTVFRCCHCGRHDRDGREVPLDDIQFDPGQEPPAAIN